MFTSKLIIWKSFKRKNRFNIVVFTLYINKKMLLLRKKIILALNLFFDLIIFIKSINILLTNINGIFLIADIEYIFFKIFLITNLFLILSLWSILMQNLNSQLSIFIISKDKSSRFLTNHSWAKLYRPSLFFI